MKGSEVNHDRPGNLIKRNVSLLKYKWKALLLLFKNPVFPTERPADKGCDTHHFSWLWDKVSYGKEGTRQVCTFHLAGLETLLLLFLMSFLLPVRQATIIWSAFLPYLT